jgi:hypothetical protein
VTLYKVTDANGHSGHGGSLQWSLPKDGSAGEWHEVMGALSLCSRGLHLTDDPVRWFQHGFRVFAVEADGVEGECSNDNARKVVARRVRLTRELTDAELIPLRILKYGDHEVKEGIVFASGFSTVTASGSSTVTASGFSTVTASGSSTVTAYDSSTVTAYDSSTVTAYGFSTVRAYDSSTVTAYGFSTVTAKNVVVVIARWGSATVKLEDRAVLVDQRGSAPIISTVAKATLKRRVKKQKKAVA